MLVRQLLLRLSFVLGLFGIVSQAHAQVTADQNPLPLSSSNWTASEANGNFLDTGTSGQHQIALVLPQNSRHFEVSLSGLQSTVADGTNVSFTVTFDNGQSLSFSGLSNSGEVKANLDDGAVAAWTHNITADQTMTITFAGIMEDPWTIPLTGTTPTITAMAKAIKMAGIDGLPGPWSIGADNSSVTTTSEPPVSTPSHQVSDQPEPQITDCVGYANLIQEITQLPDYDNSMLSFPEDETSMLYSYFKGDLSKLPDQAIDDLISQSKACVGSLQQQAAQLFNVDMVKRNQIIQQYLAIGTGINVLQGIEDLNDSTANAAAAAQQRKIDTQKNAVLISDLPTCDDSGTIANVKNTVLNSPEGKVEGIVLLGLTNISDISGPENMGYRVCQADALFNNGERKIVYKIHWFDKSQNMLSITEQDEN